MKKCVVCQKEFDPKNYWQKFCSNECKIAKWGNKQYGKLTKKGKAK